MIRVAGPPKCSALISTLVSTVALIAACSDSMAALLSAGLSNQLIDVTLFDAERLRPLRAIVQ